MNAMHHAAHILDCEDTVERAIVAWADTMSVSRAEAAHQVLSDALDMPDPDPDLIEAARKALKKERS